MTKLSPARRRANKKWNKRHKNLHKIYQYKSCAKTFINKMANKKQLLTIIKIAKERIRNYERTE